MARAGCRDAAEVQLFLFCMLLANRSIVFRSVRKYLQVLECAIYWEQQNME